MSKDNPEAFETFEFDLPPIRGFPELRWAGKRPFKSTQYFPAQKKESYGDPTDGWWNRIYWGDNLQVMSHLLREFRGQINLIYIDPPFDSQADYKKKVTLKGVSAEGDASGFEEKQYTDIWISDQYSQFIYERAIISRQLLSENGVFVVHCDPRRSHHIKSICDEVFGPDNFFNEISWVRTNSHNMKSKGFTRSHDIILFYHTGSDFIFNEQYEPYGEKQLARYKEDEDGRLYKAENITFSSANKTRQFSWRGTTPPPNRSWGASLDQLEEWWEQGRILTRSDGSPRMDGLKIYLDDTKGNPIGSVWQDIGRVGNTSAERLNYPTQKPEALLKRIISALSNPGDLVFDGFMGSGTTQSVSLQLGRRFIGADINLGAVETAVKRINLVRSAIEDRLPDFFGDGDEVRPNKYYTGFEVYNVNNYDLFRNPVEAKELIRDAMELQPLPPSSAFDGQREGYLVKIMPVNRIATRQDLNEVINGLDFKAFERRQAEAPNKPVERIHLVCMGHEPDLGPALQKDAKPFDIEVMVTDLIRDKAHLHFKKSSDARLAIENGELVIKGFYPMNLLQKLSLESDAVEDWRQLVESVKVDFHYDGAVLTPAIVDAPGKDELVAGSYVIPADAATIRVKITDLLSESWEGDIKNG
ncbi:MAG: site-specific DNA-methyltransferase [Parvibaculaceae bacterium]